MVATDAAENGDRTMTTAIAYLALYTGPGGPISHEISVGNMSDALEAVERDGKSWYDDAEDELGLDPDSPTLAEDIATALEEGGWDLVRAAGNDGAYAIYVHTEEVA
jgi:subtilisin family serine protease